MIVVTGATGHIGNVLVRELIARGQTVRALVLPDDDCRPLLGFDTELVYGDVTDLLSDVWMHAIGKNVRLAELIDSLLNIIHRKFPNMILNQMTSVKHYIHI